MMRERSEKNCVVLMEGGGSIFAESFKSGSKETNWGPEGKGKKPHICSTMSYTHTLFRYQQHNSNVEGTQQLILGHSSTGILPLLFISSQGQALGTYLTATLGEPMAASQ